MKNKKIVKFLGVLISSLIVLNSSGQIFAKKENIKQEENQKNIKEAKNLRTKLEKEMLENNIKTYKDFDENKYKVKGFRLTVYFKNYVPILYYEHIKTGAKIVIILADTMPINSTFYFPIANFNFNISTENNKQYLASFITNAIMSNFNYKDLKNKKFEGFYVYSKTSNLDINFSVTKKEKNIFKEDDNFLKKLFSYLRDPKIFKDEKTFNLERKRTLNYIKNLIKDPDIPPLNTKIKDAEKLTKDELFNFYKERIHPSNLFVTRHESFKNIKGILNFLKILDENYFKYYNSKKNNFKTHKTNVKTIYNVKPSPKDRDTYKEEKKYKFDAYLNFLVDPSDCTSNFFIKKHPLLNNYLVSKELLKNIGIKEYIKKLGYLDGNFDFSNLSLYGNEKSLFKKEKLKENSSKIFNYVLDKIKNVKEKEIEEIYEKIILPIKEHGEEHNEDRLFTNPVLFNADDSLRNVLTDNFIYYNKPFTEEFFEITPNNEIKDSKENSINRILKDIKNIETIRKEFNENQYCDIKVYSNEIKNEKKQEKEHMYIVLTPIEFKKQNKNSLLKYLAKHFLTTNFLAVKSYEKALPNYTYTTFPAPYLENYIGQCVTSNKELPKDYLNFFYEEFEESIKNYEITKEDFEQIKEDFKNFIPMENLKSKFDGGVEVIENFLKNGYEEKEEGENQNRFFKITKKTPRHLMVSHFSFLFSFCIFKDFKEYLEYHKPFAEFIKKHKLTQDDKEKIDKKFAQDFLENILKPMKKIIKNSQKMRREFKNKVDEISFKDFVKFVKSAKPVEKENLEKDQKTLRETYEVFYY